MNRGDRFNTHGYELVASIDAADGTEFSRVLVMHNNSSHFIVAKSETPLQVAVDSGTEEEEVVLVDSFEYESEPEYTHSKYEAAINLAVRTALRL